MGMMDNLKDQAQDMMDDPETRSKIEQIAKDRNISIDEAKEHYMRHKSM
jgi:hypothetical protein